MSEANVLPSAPTDPREWKRWVLAAAAEGPTAVDEATGALHVLRYRDIESILHEPRLRGVGLSLFDRMGIAAGPLRDWYGGLMFTNDGPRHDRLRRLVSKAFTPRAVDRLRAGTGALVRERLSSIRRDGGGDLVGALKDVPMHVMCTLVGVPAEDVPGFVTWVDALSPVFGYMEPEQIAAATAAIGELLVYSRDLLARRSHAPADDLMTSLLQAEHDGDRLSREETVAMVANLLVGGHDTTGSQIACTLHTLLSQPGAVADLRTDPSQLHVLVSETIRFEPSIGAAPRSVVEPIELCGVELEPGAVVMANLLAANRDAEVWRDPDAFVPRRFAEPEAPRLLSFGGGPHYCLGAALARMTLEETVHEVAALAPTLTADPGGIEWVQVLGRGPERLPVAL